MRKIQLVLFALCGTGFLVALPRLEGMTPPEGSPAAVTEVSSAPSLQDPGPVVAALDPSSVLAGLIESNRRQEQAIALLQAGLERLDLRLQAGVQATVTEVRTLAAAQARLEAKLAEPEDARLLAQLTEIHEGLVATEARLEKLGPLEARVKKLEANRPDGGLRRELEQMGDRLRRVELDRIQLLGKLLEDTPEPAKRGKR